MPTLAAASTVSHRYAEQASAPATPDSGKILLYAKTDSKFYSKDDTGTEIDLTGSLLSITNSSGDTAAIGDIGFIDEAGEYVTTTTASDAGNWCVVIKGGADEASITVRRRGNATVNYTGADPAEGDYLVTSTAAGDAQKTTTMQPNIFAVCLAAGSSGTVDVLLLTQTTFIPLTDSNPTFEIDNHSDTDFVSTINGAPSATSVVYGAVTTGDENVLDDIDANALGKARLHNLTRSDYRLIESVDAGTNTITTVSSSDSWANTDDITIESQTVTSPASDKFIDVDLSQQTSIPVLARAVFVSLTFRDSAAANEGINVHPFETYAATKQIAVASQVANIIARMIVAIPLIERVFAMRASASGAGTGTLNKINLFGYWLAAP